MSERKDTNEQVDQIADLKSELLEEIAEVIKEETTDDVELLEDEIDKSTLEIAKESIAKKDTKHMVIKTVMLIAIVGYETYCILNRDFDVLALDALVWVAAVSYFIVRLRSKEQKSRLLIELPVLLPFFLLEGHVNGGVDFLRWLVCLSMIFDYMFDFLEDLILHKQVLMIILTWSVIMFLGTIGYVRFEDMNFNDSLWLVWVTSTTVGYGDFSAVTIYGRLVTIFLMLGGIAIVSALTAFILDWMNKRSNERAREILDQQKNQK